MMKTSLIMIVALIFSLNGQSQNKNVLNTTKTTTTTVKDGAGKDKKYVKNENVIETQNIELKDKKPNTSNIEVKDSPVLVTSTTNVTNPDGSTRTTAVDRSGYYIFDNKKYKINLDAQGYSFVSEGSSKPYLLRKTSTNSYIYVNEGRMAISYFDTDGNLIIETYNDKTDAVEANKYELVKK